ncbi:uncharacterized protein LOC111312883 isoform X2 [Durio zibethinus]|uniref:Uncharacterized protein LOC111312883 isoform X2 n=1 Tax=Durio zibethinus TaxID=66656 RepID=A0A6P6AX30_DURZI|nr:uncharacterized protein LOC111312883 isoform X2 [Durio zibethinus]
MLSLPFILAPIRILFCKFSKFKEFLRSKPKQSIKPKGRERRREVMITRSNLAEQLREYQIRSKHDWASVSFFSSTSNLTSSRWSKKENLTLELVLTMCISPQKVKKKDALKLLIHLNFHQK